jgi:hypothetical protein
VSAELWIGVVLGIGIANVWQGAGRYVARLLRRAFRIDDDDDPKFPQ